MFMAWHVSRKCVAAKFTKHWISSNFCSEKRNSRCDGSGTWPECPRKDWRGESCWLHQCEAPHRPTNDQLACGYMSDLAVAPRCGTCWTITGCWKPSGFPRPHRGAVRATLVRRKAGVWLEFISKVSGFLIRFEDVYRAYFSMKSRTQPWTTLRHFKVTFDHQRSKWRLDTFQLMIDIYKCAYFVEITVSGGSLGQFRATVSLKRLWRPVKMVPFW